MAPLTLEDDVSPPSFQQPVSLVSGANDHLMLGTLMWWNSTMQAVIQHLATEIQG